MEKNEFSKKFGIFATIIKKLLKLFSFQKKKYYFNFNFSKKTLRNCFALNLSQKNQKFKKNMEEISNMESEKNKIPQSKEIYLDGFNFIEKFFTLEKKSDTLANFWDLQEPFLKIKQLVSALRNSNYLLKVFIKGDNVSKDEKDKSKRRREQELRFEQTSTPPNIPILLWSFFMELNVPVFFTYQESFDDTIVSYAQQSKAIILTSNQKLFKYKNREFRIFEKYKISQNGSISFVPLRNMKNWQKEKPILPAPAKVLTKDLLSYLWPMKKELIMGCPTPFVRRFGNPYLTLRPLRQAVYVRLGIKKMIEVIPFWDKQNGSVEWDKTLVKPDAKLDNLLDNPLEAVEAMFEVSKLKKPEDCPINMWKNYLYCLHVLVFEICCLAKDECEKKNLRINENCRKKLHGIEKGGFSDI